MGRWIVAGVIIAILVALIVSDEFGFTPTGPTIMADQNNNEVEQAIDDAMAEELPQKEEMIEGEELARKETTAACKHVVDVLKAEGGNDYAEQVANSLFGARGMTIAQVTEFCAGLKGKDATEVLDAVARTSGVRP